MLQPPGEAGWRKRGAQRRKQNEPPELAAPKRRLPVTAAREARAQRSSRVKQGRRGERSDPRAEMLHEGRRRPEEYRGRNGRPDSEGYWVC